MTGGSGYDMWHTFALKVGLQGSIDELLGIIVTVTNALAQYIHREDIRSEFWERMEGPSEETCDAAFPVFDRCGAV
jgi:hypothetical protein